MLPACSWRTLVSPKFVHQCVAAHATSQAIGSVIQPVRSMAGGHTEGNFNKLTLSFIKLYITII